MSEQAVNSTTEEEPKVSSEGEVAQEPDLDTLLSEFDESESSKEEPKVAQPQSDDVQWLKAQRAQYEREQQDKALSEAATIIKENIGELPIEIPEYVFKGVLQQKAYEDADGRLIKAFQNRFNQPEKWKSIVKTIGKEIKRDFVPRDKQATDSWNAVESAVHGASKSTRVEEPVDISKMNDAEFFEYKMRLGRK